MGLTAFLFAVVFVMEVSITPLAYSADESRHAQAEGVHVFYEGTYESPKVPANINKEAPKNQEWSTEEAKRAFGTEDDTVNPALLKSRKQSVVNKKAENKPTQAKKINKKSPPPKVENNDTANDRDYLSEVRAKSAETPNYYQSNQSNYNSTHIRTNTYNKDSNSYDKITIPAVGSRIKLNRQIAVCGTQNDFFKFNSLARAGDGSSNFMIDNEQCVWIRAGRTIIVEYAKTVEQPAMIRLEGLPTSFYTHVWQLVTPYQ